MPLSWGEAAVTGRERREVKHKPASSYLICNELIVSAPYAF